VNRRVDILSSLSTAELTVIYRGKPWTSRNATRNSQNFHSENYGL